MSVEEIVAATNRQLIDRLAVLELQTIISRRPDPARRKEQARIWQQFAVRRRANRLRMTPKRIRGEVHSTMIRHASSSTRY